MAALLAGLPVEVPGVTVNRLCASGLEAVNQASRALRLGEGELYLAGGSESMSRAPWVMPKPESGYRPRRADPARHGARLAPDQPEDGRALLDRVDGRDGRERRRALRDLARRPGRLRAAQPPARGGGPGAGLVRRPAGRRRGPGPSARRDGHGRGRRGAARRHHARAARRTAARVPRGRHGDRGQRLDAQRRRRLPRARLGVEGAASSGPSRSPGWSQAASPASIRR